jgi:30S ribosomal protein S31
MGKGDLRSRRGKIYNGSHGKKRPGRAKKAAPVTRTSAAPTRSSSNKSR